MKRIFAIVLLVLAGLVSSAQTGEHLGAMKGRNHRQKGHAYQGMDRRRILLQSQDGLFIVRL